MLLIWQIDNFLPGNLNINRAELLVGSALFFKNLNSFDQTPFCILKMLLS